MPTDQQSTPITADPGEQSSLLFDQQPAIEATLDDFAADALAGVHDREVEHAETIEQHAAEETEGQARHRERHAERAQKHRARLADPEKAAARYRSLVERTRLLTDGECRYLQVLVSFGDKDLTDIFPSRKRIRRRLGGARRSIERINQLRAACVAKGFLAVWSVTCDVDEDLEAPDTAGRFISAVCYQVRLPAGVLAPGAPAWDGPVDWSNRTWGQRCRM